MLKQNVCLIFLIVFSKAINKEMKNKETSKRERVCVCVRAILCIAKDLRQGQSARTVWCRETEIVH